MNIFDNIQKTILSLSDKAHKTLNTTKLDFKIKSYNKDIEDFYNKIGKLIYDCKKNNKQVNADELNKMCNNIDKLKSKIKSLEKQILKIKNESEQQQNCNNCEIKEYSNYSVLNKNENDLKILRTEEGIKFLKFCSECNTGNNPEAEICINCGHKFK